MSSKLSSSFYTNADVLQVARDLIGCKLVTNINGIRTSGIIVETEAYNGRTDKACHAYANKQTTRTEVMYREGGIAYVYFVYGMHYLFNVVTHTKGFADAVLIRAIEPLEGIKEMMIRRKTSKFSTLLTAGPARLSQALGINKEINGLSLTDDTVWIEKSDDNFLPKITVSKRVGVNYAGEDANLMWRFFIIGNMFVSK